MKLRTFAVSVVLWLGTSPMYGEFAFGHEESKTYLDLHRDGERWRIEGSLASTATGAPTLRNCRISEDAVRQLSEPTARRQVLWSARCPAALHLRVPRSWGPTVVHAVMGSQTKKATLSGEGALDWVPVAQALDPVPVAVDPSPSRWPLYGAGLVVVLAGLVWVSFRKRRA